MSDTITPRLRIKAQPEIVVRAKAVPPPKVRFRVTPALLPMQIELQNTGTMVQWRYLNGVWQDLIAIDDIDTTVSVGSVTTLPPGSPATVVNVGTAKDMALNFGIPAGVQGIQGIAATVAVGSTTTVNAGVPASVVNVGTPNDAVFNFEIPQGPAATVAVGTVTTLAPGAVATVVNVGTSGAAVLNFGIPQGAPGDMTGPASAVDNRVAVFDGTTGKLLKDSGVILGTAASKNTGTSAGQVPLLDGSGLLDTAVLPAVAITDVFTVASQAAMLALTAQKGDIAIRTDLNKSFALATNSPGTLADWKELLTPTDAVLSVAGLTGAISSGALKTALALDNVSNTSDATKNSAVATLTNKRINPRVFSEASNATPTPAADSYDQHNITALAAAAAFAAPTGTPTDGQKLMVRIKDNGTARALTWNAIYRALGSALPTTTVAGKTLYIGLIYNAADSKWDVVAVAQE